MSKKKKGKQQMKFHVDTKHFFEEVLRNEIRQEKTHSGYNKRARSLAAKLGHLRKGRLKKI